MGKKRQKADYEREEYQNDVGYQNRTEITLDYVVAKRGQGLFRSMEFFCPFSAETGDFFVSYHVPRTEKRERRDKEKGALSDTDHTQPQHFYFTTKRSVCKYGFVKSLKLLPNKQKIFVNF